MKIPKELTREHVLKAIEDLDRGIPTGFSASKKYDLVIQKAMLIWDRLSISLWCGMANPLDTLPYSRSANPPSTPRLICFAPPSLITPAP